MINKTKKSQEILLLTGFIVSLFILIYTFIGSREIGYILFFIFTSIICLSLFSTSFYYFKLKKRFNFWKILFANIISSTIASAMYLVSFILLSYLIIKNINFPSDFFILTIIIFIPLFFFLMTYLYLTIIIINRFCKTFEFDAFFKFRHFPLSIWNLLSTKQENIKKSVIKSSLILSILLFSVFFIYLSNSLFEDEPLNNFKNKNDLKPTLGSHDPLRKEILIDVYRSTLKIRNYSNISVEVLNSKYFFGNNESDTKELKILEKQGDIYYECDNYLLNCKTKKIETGKTIKENINVENYGFSISASNNKISEDIYLIPKISLEEMYSNDVFFAAPEIAKTQIGKETSLLYKNYNNNYNSFMEKLPNKESNLEMYYWYYFDNFKGITEYTLDSWQLLRDYTYMHIFFEIVYENYEYIKLNELYSKRLPYNTSSNEDYIKTLELNIQNLNKMDSQTSKKKTNLSSCNEDIFFLSNTGKSLYEETLNTIVINSNIYKILFSLAIEGCKKFGTIDFSKEVSNHPIIKDKRYTDNLSKIVKLNIQQSTISNRIINECEDLNCKKKIIEITQDVEQCGLVYNYDYGSNGYSNCIMKYISYEKDSFYCNDLLYEEEKQKCLEKTKN